MPWDAGTELTKFWPAFTAPLLCDPVIFAQVKSVRMPPLPMRPSADVPTASVPVCETPMFVDTDGGTVAAAMPSVATKLPS